MTESAEPGRSLDVNATVAAPDGSASVGETADAPVAAPVAIPPAVTAGELLRQARTARAVTLESLAMALKVQLRKLEALEDNRLDDLPDATFARALAQSVCRQLQADPAPVLALLPQAGYAPRLERVTHGLNEPFRSGGGTSVLPPLELASLGRPGVLLAIIAVAAALVWLWPRSAPAPEPAAREARPDPATASPASVPAASLPAAVASAGPQVASMPASGVAGGAPAPAAPVLRASGAVPARAALAASVAGKGASGALASVPGAPGASAAAGDSGDLLVAASGDSWVEVTDGTGRLAISRVVKAGESVSIGGPAPYRVRVGNVRDTTLLYKGTPVDLTSGNHGNVATVKLP